KPVFGLARQSDLDRVLIPDHFRSVDHLPPPCLIGDELCELPVTAAVSSSAAHFEWVRGHRGRPSPIGWQQRAALSRKRSRHNNVLPAASSMRRLAFAYPLPLRGRRSARNSDMTDFAAARRMMVDGQVRTSDVTDLRIVAAMLELPRERFVPESKADLAYLDFDIAVKE